MVEDTYISLNHHLTNKSANIIVVDLGRVVPVFIKLDPSSYDV